MIEYEETIKGVAVRYEKRGLRWEVVKPFRCCPFWHLVDARNYAHSYFQDEGHVKLHTKEKKCQ